MFLGHFALGFGAKRLAPRVSLGTLLLACQLADLVWPVLVLVGVERVEIAPGITAVTPLDFVSYPWSHSALALLLWSLALADLYGWSRRPRSWAPATLGLLVFSHWVLDVISHRPDMPLAPGSSTRLGLGLWNSVPATLAVELALFLVGVLLYARATRPRDRTGQLALAGLVGFLLAVYAANLVAPPPPGAAAVAWSALAMWLLVAWGYWIDRHRCAR